MLNDRFHIESRGYHPPARPFPYNEPAWKRVLIKVWQNVFLRAQDKYKEILDPPYYLVYDKVSKGFVRWTFQPRPHTDEREGDIIKFRSMQEAEAFVNKTR